MTYSPGDARFIDTLIRKGYGFTFYLDSQPVHFTISTDDIAKYRDTRFLFSDNVPLGFVDRYNRAVLFNAYRFDIFYRRRPDNRFNIVMATVHPLSMTEAHQRDEGFDIRDFVFLSENHPTDVQWMYSVRFHTDEEANVRQFSPKMALEMPQLSYYYRRYLATCAAVLLFAPLLVYVLVARFSPMQPRHSSGLALLGALGSTCLAWFPTVASVCFFAACTSLFWLFSVAALSSNSIAFPIVSAALAAPLMGLVCLRLRSTFSRKLAVRTPFSAGGQMVALSAGFGLFVSLGFFVLELIDLQRVRQDEEAQHGDVPEAVGVYQERRLHAAAAEPASGPVEALGRLDIRVPGPARENRHHHGQRLLRGADFRQAACW